jgi:hypothetical protein
MAILLKEIIKAVTSRVIRLKIMLFFDNTSMMLISEVVLSSLVEC